MSLSDPIADMLTRIRNAGKAKFNSVDIPGSRLKTEMARVLKNEGYIRNYKFVKDGRQVFYFTCQPADGIAWNEVASQRLSIFRRRSVPNT